uniref:Gustatory receptor n=1 Tax=Romanomermis culicivorax TaxID=13658 RepID=A0A915K4V9_ROMCU
MSLEIAEYTRWGANVRRAQSKMGAKENTVKAIKKLFVMSDREPSPTLIDNSRRKPAVTLAGENDEDDDDYRLPDDTVNTDYRSTVENEKIADNHHQRPSKKKNRQNRSSISNKNSQENIKQKEKPRTVTASDLESQLTCDDDKTQNLNFYKVFRYFCVLVGIWIADDKLDVGAYESGRRRFFRRTMVFLRRIYTLFVTSVFFVCAMGSMRFWFIGEQGFSLQKIQCLILSVWLLCGLTSMIFVLYWQLDGKLRRHSIFLLQATNQEGTKNFRLRLYMTSTLIFLTLVTLIVNFNIFMAYHKMNDEPWSKIPVVKRLMFDQPKSQFFVIFALFYCAFSFVCALCVFHLTCTVDGLEFKFLNWLMTREQKMSRQTTTKYLDKHAQLTSLVSSANQIFKFYILAKFCFLMPSFVLNLYALIILKSFATTIDMLILISWLLICLITILTLTVPPSMIHSQCIRTSEILYEKIDLHVLSSDKRSSTTVAISSDKYLSLSKNLKL